ncbi:MAG: hypothetical protein HY774_01365 [Acidobacteria bacterium]|nr:hypothetical protein [Acidobacteriota bacterium]
MAKGGPGKSKRVSPAEIHRFPRGFILEPHLPPGGDGLSPLVNEKLAWTARSGSFGQRL